MNSKTQHTPEPSKQLKALFQELVAITTEDIKNKDWAIQRWIGQEPFGSFSVLELMSPVQTYEEEVEILQARNDNQRHMIESLTEQRGKQRQLIDYAIAAFKRVQADTYELHPQTYTLACEAEKKLKGGSND